MAFHHVDDPEDPRIAEYRNVPDAVLLRQHRLFVAEGRLVVRRLLGQNRLSAESVMVTAAAARALDAVAALADAACPVYVVPQHVMDGITGFNMHRGCLAIGRRPEPVPWADVVAGARRIVVLDRVGNADNVGVIFRNAAALGGDAVLLGPDCADPLYRKAIRTSMGAVLTMPFATVDELRAVLDAVRAQGVTTVGLTPRADAPTLRATLDALGDPAHTRLALLVGHEGDGLADETMRGCTHLARIPMPPGVDSLNVATATAIALYACYDAASSRLPR